MKQSYLSQWDIQQIMGYSTLKRDNKMTKHEFIAICLENSIDLNIALDNENLSNALYNRDDKKVEKIIKEEF